MLIRHGDDGTGLVTQPTHAWVSAQIGACWGGPGFAEVEPRDRVLEAASRHDDGWIRWEREPAWNPETGRPFTYMDLPLDDHLEVFRRGVASARVVDEYVALLVSRHSTGLLRRHRPPESAPEEEAETIRRFLRQQAAFQERVRRRLSESPATARWAEEEHLRRTGALIAAWDGMSLSLCGGLDVERRFEVPGVSGERTVTLRPAGAFTPSGDGAETGDDATVDAERPGARQRIRVTPWPFGPDVVDLAFRGLRTEVDFADAAAMDRALDAARSVEHRLRLAPR